jgi:hypothetical protein
MANSTLINKNVGTELRNLAIGSVDASIYEATWMCAETSRINVLVEEDNGDAIIDTSFAEMNNAQATHYYSKSIYNVNFGLQERPKTDLRLTKRVQSMQITLNGIGPILNADYDLSKDYDGLLRMTTTREDRGLWYFQTDTDELIRGATLAIVYEYTVTNEGEIDYLSKGLVNIYTGTANGLNNENTRTDNGIYNEYNNKYNEYLQAKSGEVKQAIQGRSYANAVGTYLGSTYYTGNAAASDVSRVPTRAEKIEEAINNDLSFDTNSQTNEGVSFAKVTSSEGLPSVNELGTEKARERSNQASGTTRVIYGENYYDNKADTKNEKINTVVQTKKPTNALTPGQEDRKQLQLTRVLNSREDRLEYPSYIAEIYSFSNAAGRRDTDSVPGNLKYVHSEDSRVTISLSDNYNEDDEHWAETIRITKPTGEDKSIDVYVIITVAGALAIIGVGVVLIRKFVLR